MTYPGPQPPQPQRVRPAPQRSYRVLLGKAATAPEQETLAERVQREEGAKKLYRVGFNPNQKGRIDPTTGERYLTGVYPTQQGIAGALRRVRSNRVEVRVYGRPAWNTKKRKSPEPDALGNVWATYFVSRTELEGALSLGADAADLVYSTGSYNFAEVLTVAVKEA